MECHKSISVLVAFVCCVLSIACSSDTEMPVYDDKITYYHSLYDAPEHQDKFLFITDPHYLEEGGKSTDWGTVMVTKLQYVRDIYNKSNASFLVNGGDWLICNDTQAEACAKLAYANSLLRSYFPNYYPVLGNHDTNYQGYIDETSRDKDNVDGILSNETLTSLLFNEYDKLYYSFKTTNATYYVLDTGIDWGEQMTDYRWEQLAWLAQSLISDDPTHCTIIQHIVIFDQKKSSFAENEATIIKAYNEREHLTLSNGREFDFSDCTGHIDFIMAGHTHYDYITELGGVPAIITTTAKGKNVTFDLVLVDYSKNKVYCVRIGKGQNRVIQI